LQQLTPSDDFSYVSFKNILRDIHAGNCVIAFLIDFENVRDWTHSQPTSSVVNSSEISLLIITGVSSNKQRTLTQRNWPNRLRTSDVLGLQSALDVIEYSLAIHFYTPKIEMFQQLQADHFNQSQQTVPCDAVLFHVMRFCSWKLSVVLCADWTMSTLDNPLKKMIEASGWAKSFFWISEMGGKSRGREGAWCCWWNWNRFWMWEGWAQSGLCYLRYYARQNAFIGVSVWLATGH